jgi:NAD(P)H-quinone oxidoreductase subunit 5
MTQFFAQTIGLAPIYPLIGMVLSLRWSPSITRRTGPRPAGYINLLMTLLAFLQAALAFPATLEQPVLYQSFPWLQVAGLNLTIPLEISSITAGAIAVITGINFLAQFYAIGYMEMDWGWARFFSLLALFEAGMTALVLCNSLFFSYMILEFLTLGTYLLIGFWFNQSLVVTGARDAFLTKRVGDLFLLMGVLALYPLAGTWDFQELAVWAQTAHLNPAISTFLGLALIAGPMGKCAQFPLHLWLDEAMEGPVPSTILRNSVVVATGAWVLIKLEPVLTLSPVALSVAIAIGAISAIGGTLIAIAQIDIKRSLSYLVTSYMGLVFIAVGTQQSGAALLIVLAHAVAMSLLVASMGNIVWNTVTQDLTQYGGLWSRRPITGLSFLVGLAGLVALPPFGGFWALLDLADGLWSTRPILVGIVLVVNALAAFGLTRVFCLVWGGKPQQMTERSPEALWLLVLPMLVFVGFTLHLPLLLQVADLLPSWVAINKDVALLTVWSTIFGCTLSAVIYLNNGISKPIQLPWKPLQDLLAYDFYTPVLYRSSIVFGVDLISRFTAWLDKYLVDGTINLFGQVTLFSGQSLKYSTTGKSQAYALTILLGTAFLGFLIGWPMLSRMSLSLG